MKTVIRSIKSLLFGFVLCTCCAQSALLFSREPENKDETSVLVNGKKLEARVVSIEHENKKRSVVIFTRKEAQATMQGGRVHGAGFYYKGAALIPLMLEAHRRSSCWMYPFWENKKYLGSYEFSQDREEFIGLVFIDDKKAGSKGA